MKRSMAIAALAAAATLGAVAPSAGASENVETAEQTTRAAAPVSTFDPSTSWGSASGTITWYNRSVTVQGSVHDKASGRADTQVQFRFYSGCLSTDCDHPTLVDYQTRTVSGGATGRTLPYNFGVTADVPGGVSLVVVRVCHEAEAACSIPDQYRFRS
ncbi:hypothetical protein [Jiangella sp. DSM 45060]|uniref:hypothetical protein n=1 Tax=Jiangella sp. DSM 45060 TaxID=1798224 RepID=UPI00087DB96A|nr:hypothetical protein [Jiangella sp. DSM 45060]SDS14113.1 hypothetical protein SAMN04515669_0424 [Jiangella sp. DSM 45060]